MSFIKRHWFALLFTTGLLARLPQLVMPYWYDEAWTDWISALPFNRMLSAVAGDVQPVLFFVFTWLVNQIAPWALRIIPLLFSLASIVLVRELARKLNIPTDAQVVAVLLMVLSPWQTYYGAELRCYSMLEFSVLLAWLCVLRRQWIGVGVGIWLTINSHNVGFIYAAVIGLYAIWQERRLVQPALAFGAAFIAFLPTLPLLLEQLRAAGAGYWISHPALADILLTPYNSLFFGAEGVRDVIGMAIMIGLIVLIVLHWRTHPPMLIFAAVAPLAIIGTISLITTPVYLDRVLIGCSPFFYLLIGLELSRDKSPQWRIAAMALLLPAFAVMAISPARERMTDRYQSRAVADLIRDDDPDMPIWNLGPADLVELHQYGLPNPQYLVPGFASVSAGYYSQQTMDAMGIQQRPVNIAGHAWLVVPKDGGLETDKPVAAICAAHTCVQWLAYTAHEPMYGVEVYEVWR